MSAPVDPIVILLYGALVFFATFVASFLFGFAQGFAKARGKPLSERTLALLKYPERATELLAVMLVLSHMMTRQPNLNDGVLHGLAAVLFGSLIAFILEVRTKLMPAKEFVMRLLVGLTVCVPAAMYISLMQAPIRSSFSGTFVMGFEASVFMPQDGQWQGQHWWLSGNVDEAIAPYLKNGKTPFEVPPLSIKVIGTLSRKGNYGHMGRYERELIVERVISAKPRDQ